ncbi:hypothetical protein HMPREF0185_02236 [Brevundimonas diminuta 470-4]|nr:hypothetical protein HMPREF0185_02236 [Brevundimonas diminuta 470-4]
MSSDGSCGRLRAKVSSVRGGVFGRNVYLSRSIPALKAGDL